MECTPIEHREMDQERIHKEIGLFRHLKDRWMENRAGNIKPGQAKYFPGKRSNR